MTPELPETGHFHYEGGALLCEGVPLSRVAQELGTPVYVYSRRAIEEAFRAYQSAVGDGPALLCYAVKANSNLGVLSILARMGAGFDIVSGGELARALRAGADPAKIVYSGVGKGVGEIEAAVAAGIASINVESESELERIERIAARLGKIAPVSVRVNPDVDAKTHPNISTGRKENKFGVPYARAAALYRRAASLPHVNPIGIDAHVGSQVTALEPFLDTADRTIAIVHELRGEGIRLSHIDFGGGLGIRYRDETPPRAEDLVRGLRARLVERGLGDMTMVLEPGRSIVGNAGVLLTRVEFLKAGEDRRFAIVDAGMNDLARPAMYQAWHGVVPVAPRDTEPATYDVVGPICESTDWLARSRPLALEEGDLLAVTSAGAYGSSMSSSYNSRGRAPEVICDGDAFAVVRRRETVEDILAMERPMP